jgi:hypothetical protein
VIAMGVMRVMKVIKSNVKQNESRYRQANRQEIREPRSLTLSSHRPYSEKTFFTTKVTALSTLSLSQVLMLLLRVFCELVIPTVSPWLRILIAYLPGF